MATLADIQNKIYSLTGTDVTSYPNANMLIDLNQWNQKVTSMILDSEDETDYDDPNNTDYPVYKVLMTVNRDIQIPAAVRMLKIKSVSISYDGVTLYPATPYDIGEGYQPIADAANTAAQAAIDANMSRTAPKFDIKFGSIWTYPMANSTDVSNGAYVMFECFRQPYEFTLSDLTTGTLSPGFDASFHHMMSYGPSMEYCTAKQLPQLKMIAATLGDYEIRLRRQYSSKQLDRRYAMTPDYQSMK